MRAFEYREYGPPEVLQLIETPMPTPNDNEVLVKIHAAAVNPLDCHSMRGRPLFLRLMNGGLRKPKEVRIGADMAGEVEAVGESVTAFKPGDSVFGACSGALAEYACAAQDRLALKPENISYEEAAAVPVAAITALQGLRDKGQIQPGQQIAVDGASGGVGTFAVQIAKALGADVTAICSTRNAERAQSIGAGEVIDYTQEDFTRHRKGYDLIFAANAYHSIFDYGRALNPNGIYVMAGGGGTQILQAIFVGPLLSLMGSKKFKFFVANINKRDLGVLRDLLADEKIVPIIDRRYGLSDVPEAVRYLEEGHAQGKVVINVSESET